jgi:type IX secretion system PorP/SprF family membrane protein
MKKLVTLATICLCLEVCAQDIPMISQRLSNSFIYNPALAGQTTGSATYTYRKNYAGVQGAPENHFLGLHSPFSEYKGGIGLTLMHEKTNALQAFEASAAFAYHIRNRTEGFSFGAALEYSSSVITGQSNVNPTAADPILFAYQNRVPSFDASVGVHYQSEYFKTGVALNKLMSSWINKNIPLLANYFSSYVQGQLPARNAKDLFEPYFSVRRFSPLYIGWEVGAYYSFQEKLMLGAGFRKGSGINGSIGVYISERLLISYGHEINRSSVGSELGSSNEFSIRLDFSSYAERKRLLKECITHAPYHKQKSVSQRGKIKNARKKHNRRRPGRKH